MIKKILITGESSYIGHKFKEWLEKKTNNYVVDKISLRTEEWKKKKFSNYDVIYHVVGIAHIKETKKNANLYFQINRDLTYELALKARNEGVKQFIFLSSMSVYGIDNGEINRDTIPRPQKNYGKSKLQAEKLILELENENFKVAIVRPPLVYGDKCKGNYSKLRNLAIKSPFFPKIRNQRSMIFIDNLSEFVKTLIETQENGIFHPQNKDYIVTSDIVKLISKAHDSNIIMVKLPYDFLKKLPLGLAKKIFGDLVYDKKIDAYKCEYITCDFETSILLSEKRK